MNTMKLKLVGALTVAGSYLGLASAHAQTVPTAGTSDIAEANGPVWTALLDIIKYYIATYGTLMLWILGIIAVFVFAVLLFKHFFK